jgi:hypothetical protein
MNALITECRPAADEGAVGFLIRALALNSSSMREALEYTYGHSRRHRNVSMTLLHPAS